ncbi:MAG: TlpA family protein disulfide reductase [Propioniciclava sp.]
MNSRLLVVLAMALALVLAGCSWTAALPGEVPESSVADTATPEDLEALRTSAGLPDCPESELDADAIPGGLPAVVLGCLGSDRQVNLAGLRGKPMVVNVWAQWCGPCREETPALGRFAAAVHEEVLVLGVDYSDPDPRAALTFAAQGGATYASVTDPYRQIAGPLKVTGIPTTLFVNADGVIVFTSVGAVDDETLAALASEHLGVTV